jgi:uncharacterized protein involved in exopolysaccharide biosynthesis
MRAQDPNAELDEETTEEGEGLDFEQVKDLVGFVWRAPRRRPKLAACVFALVAGLGWAVALTMPRTYNSEVRLLAQRDLVLPALSNPGRAVPRDADNPTKNVAEMILRRDNLVALAKQANLVDRFVATRSPALRLKDRILGVSASEQDILRGLVATLGKKLVVTTSDATVTISVDWSNAELAYDLAVLVQKNFLEARYDADVSVITDALSVLQDHSKTELARVDEALAELDKAQADSRGGVVASPAPARRPQPVATSPAAARPAQPSAPSAPAAVQPAGDSDLARSLEETRQQIRAIEVEQQRQLDAVRQQLAQAQLTLTAQHPTVLALQQKLESLNEPSPELAQLKAQERSLMAQIAPSGRSGATAAAGPSPQAPAQAASTPAPMPDYSSPAARGESGTVQIARSRLEVAVRRYQDVMSRIDAANIELDITRAAFKYRYTVLSPAELATSPKKPIAKLIAVGSVLVGGLLALLLAAAADFLTGRVFETWQVRRRLGLTVLGEFEPPV